MDDLAGSGGRTILSPRERRERNREEMVSAILETARAIMREEGVTALNLNELARRLGMTTPALYAYFPSKVAIYDAVFRIGLRLLRESDEQVWRDHAPDWERIRIWFETRLRIAREHPELYHLTVDIPVPGFTPSDESLTEAQGLRGGVIKGLRQMIETGLIDPGISVERAADLLLTMRHGIVAERIGKAPALPQGTERFAYVIEDALAVFQAAWSPHAADHRVDPDPSERR